MREEGDARVELMTADLISRAYAEARSAQKYLDGAGSLAATCCPGNPVRQRRFDA